MSESGPSCRSSKELGSARSALIAGFARIELMTPSELLDLAWSYPLFEALYGRRSRRFGLGFEMPGGPLRYKSPHKPGPPREIQGTLLGGAGGRLSRPAPWGLPAPGPFPSRRRRTMPTK